MTTRTTLQMILTKMILTKVVGTGNNGNNIMTGTTTTQTEPGSGTAMNMGGSYQQKKIIQKTIKLHTTHGKTCLNQHPIYHRCFGTKTDRPFATNILTWAGEDQRYQQCPAT